MEDATPTTDGQALTAMLPGAVADEVLRVLSGTMRLETWRSPQQGELIKALCRARPNFGVVERSRTAKVTPREGKGAPYTYDYATLSDSIAATVDALAAEELAVFQDFDQPPGEIIIYTELAHGSDQWRRSKLTMPLARDAGPQGIGSAITYGRRYARNAMLDLAPADDDDGQAAQRGLGREGRDADQGGSDGLLTLEEVPKVAQADPAAAFAAVRRLIASVMGCGDISEPRQRRLYGLAHSDRGWTADQVDTAVTRLLGAASVPRIPYKAYEQVVALFQNVVPSAVLAAPPQQQAPAGPPPSQGQQQPPPPSQPPSEPLPTWREAWDKIRADYDDLAPGDLENPLGAANAPAVMEAFTKAGWTPQEVADVLRTELYGATIEKLPKDGTHPPVYRKIARAFRVYKPDEVKAAYPGIYGWDAPPPHEEEPPFGDDTPPPADDASGTVIAEALALIPDQFPQTADEAWRSIRAAMDMIGQHHPEALVAITPDDRLTLFRRQANGNRSTGDVDALCRHHLGVRVESVPSLVFEPVLRLLAAFPSRAPGKEEVLGKLPADPAKSKPVELRDLLQKLVQDGTIQDDEITRSGEGGKVTKDDMVGTIERVRERALLEAGHA